MAHGSAIPPVPLAPPEPSKGGVKILTAVGSVDLQGEGAQSRDLDLSGGPRCKHKADFQSDLNRHSLGIATLSATENRAVVSWKGPGEPIVLTIYGPAGEAVAVPLLPKRALTLAQELLTCGVSAIKADSWDARYGQGAPQRAPDLWAAAPL